MNNEHMTDVKWCWSLGRMSEGVIVV